MCYLATGGNAGSKKMGSSARWHPSSLKFCIAPNLGPLRQNSIKVIDWTQRLLPEEESGSTRPNIGYSQTPIALRFAVIRTAGYP
jgi:hypothetical protein